MSTHLLAQIKKSLNAKLDDLRRDAISGLSMEQYHAICGQHRGVEWALTELEVLFQNYNSGSADLDDEEDGMSAKHN